MGIVILKFSSRFERHLKDKSDSQSDWLLGYLLENMSGQGDINYYKKWLNDDNESFGGGNSLELQKDQGNIYITLAFDERQFPDECEIPISAFTKMLDDWSEILKQRPPYIVIIHDGASITIQGYDQDPSNLFEKPTD